MNRNIYIYINFSSVIYANGYDIIDEIYNI